MNTSVTIRCSILHHTQELCVCYFAHSYLPDSLDEGPCHVMLTPSNFFHLIVFITKVFLNRLPVCKYRIRITNIQQYVRIPVCNVLVAF